MVNARKKLIFGVLEKSGQPNLGFEPTATTPEVSLYRTVLVRPGLYRQSESNWRWSNPSEISDAGLSEVWKILEDFFVTPGKSKDFSKLIESLTSPPYGVRRGILPILIGAGLQAFGKAVAIRHKNEYLPDILPSQIESICSHPEEFSIQVVQLDRKTKQYFEKLINQFANEPILVQEELVRQFHDAITVWKSRLPATALRTQKVSANARKFQQIIKKEYDPVELALVELPNLAKSKKDSYEAITKSVESARKELESIVDRYTQAAVSVIRDVISINSNSSQDCLHAAKEWSECFSEDLLSNGVLEPVERAILTRASDATNDRFTEASFARAISTIVLDKEIKNWVDRSSIQFEIKLKEIVSRIEMSALESGRPSIVTAPLLKNRIQQWYSKLDNVLGREEAVAFLNELENVSNSTCSDMPSVRKE